MTGFDPNEFERKVREEAERVSSKPRRELRSDKSNGGEANQMLPSPAKPMAVARVFVAHEHTETGELTLRYWRGAWWGWRRSHWREMEPREVRGELYGFTEHGTYVTIRTRSLRGRPTVTRSAIFWKHSGPFAC